MSIQPELVRAVAAFVPDHTVRCIVTGHPPKPGDVSISEGAVIFADIAGFTPMAERLARMMRGQAHQAEAPGAEELAAELRELGAERVTIASCDVAERRDLARMLDSVAEEHPLRAVFHLAGVLDDGVVEELTEERLQRVLAPKVEGALHLHELTQRLELTTFVLFSSAAQAPRPPSSSAARSNPTHLSIHHTRAAHTELNPSYSTTRESSPTPSAPIASQNASGVGRAKAIGLSMSESAPLRSAKPAVGM